MDATSLAFVRASLGQVRIPTASDRVYKEECVLTFDAPHCPTGLYLNLSTLQSKGKGVLEHDHAKTGAPLYLHQQWTKVFRDQAAAGADATADVDVSALTVSFAEKWDWQKDLSLVLMPGKQSIEIVPELPDKLHQAIAAIMASADPHAVADPYSFVQKVEVSKYALELAYLDNGLKISPNPADWKCEVWQPLLTPLIMLSLLFYYPY
jgi:ubiquitin carboxyl-terminal hydrolase 5/13